MKKKYYDKEIKVMIDGKEYIGTTNDESKFVKIGSMFYSKSHLLNVSSSEMLVKKKPEDCSDCILYVPVDSYEGDKLIDHIHKCLLGCQDYCDCTLIEVESGENNEGINKMTKYETNKEKARQKAIEWQAGFSNHNYSYGELAEFSERFTILGKQYGLMKEFKENGIL